LCFIKGGESGISSPADAVNPILLEPKYSSTQAMEALMTEYEKELQTPIKGIMFGSLMTAILIQATG